MAAFSPKFCSTHLTIHVCDLQDITKKVASIEDDLGAKVRRLHGIQTEEEIEVEASKRKHQPGTLGDILEKAKKNAAKERAKVNSKGGISGDDTLIPVSENEITDRMAALRAKMLGESALPSPSTNDQDSSLGSVIQKARQFQSDNPEEVFQVPERSKIGEKDNKHLGRGNKPSAVLKDLDLDLLNESDIKNAKNNASNLFDESEITNVSQIIESSIEDPIIEKQEQINDDESKKVFTEEETQELIQSAVKEALKQVGLIDSNNKPKKVALTKTTTTSKTTTANKSTKPTTVKKTTSTNKPKPKTTTSTVKAKKEDNFKVDKAKIPDLN